MVEISKAEKKRLTDAILAITYWSSWTGELQNSFVEDTNVLDYLPDYAKKALVERRIKERQNAL